MSSNKTVGCSLLLFNSQRGGRRTKSLSAHLRLIYHASAQIVGAHLRTCCLSLSTFSGTGCSSGETVQPSCIAPHLFSLLFPFPSFSHIYTPSILSGTHLPPSSCTSTTRSLGLPLSVCQESCSRPWRACCLATGAGIWQRRMSSS